MEEPLTEEETVEEARAEFEAVTEPEAPGEFQEPEPAPAPFQFGKRDPHDKARRLARVLVSDMITYNPDRHAKALEARTLKADFDEEIEKSWAEYVEQVLNTQKEAGRFEQIRCDHIGNLNGCRHDDYRH